MIRNLRDTTQKNTEQDWLKTNLAKFSRMLQGQKDLNTVARLILSELAPVVTAQYAVFYVLDPSGETQKLSLLASYAARGEGFRNQIALGEGLVGQCALEKQKILLANVPADYIRIASGLGEAAPQNILVLPVVFEGQLKGVLELASFDRFNSTHQAFLDQLTESIGIVLNTIEANMRTEDLLKQSQSLAQELQSRQEELQQTNQELQEKARQLAHQNQEVERKNQEVEKARQALEEQAKQLALTSKYKSEFLANMSHELRTPLNSLLILSDQLSKNPEGNLSPKQTEFAKTIHSAGNDLLMLINDILDLSKIESGTVVVDIGEVRLSDLHGYVERTFRPVAESKNVGFEIRMANILPGFMLTDAKRLQQVLKNLLSNAFKFTHHGQVTLSIEPINTGWNPENESLNNAANVLAFSVSDTGIGIPPEKQQIIFEAFQQADGSTSRKYGGTGLGLAISRELSRLLGGEIRLVSAPNKGSTFTLYLPQAYTPPRSPRKPTSVSAIVAEAAAAASGTVNRLAAFPAPSAAPPAPAPSREFNGESGNGAALPETEPIPEEIISHLVNEVGDDRDNIRPGDHTVLIVENDLGFARFLLDVAHERGFKVLVTSLGAAALAMAREYQPDVLTLDIFLPDIDGWRVLERLKNDMQTRHIPVCVISTDDSRERALNSGALGFVAKPIKTREDVDRVIDALKDYVNRPSHCLLVAEPDAERRERIIRSVADDGIDVATAKDGKTALEIVQDRPVDCVIFSADIHDVTPDDLADGFRKLHSFGPLPVLVFSEGEDILDDDGGWKRLNDVCTVRKIQSSERLLDQATFFLHRDIADLPAPKREILHNLHRPDRVLPGKKVLIVDDDMRNIFALSTVLEEHEMAVLSTDNGPDAIKILKAEPNIDIVLMDIMMPVMDGMETMREIRKIPALKALPIIAVTAKAMKGDREKCIEAGAWDYLSKPVDTEQMLAVLRAWLHR
jgi:signal transduction histidine kinase/CheY-like chemotaxis protein